MRHTLIPKELKKSLRHEYRVRAFIVLLFMVSAAMVVGIVSVLPAFIHASAQKSSAERSLLSMGGTVSTTTQSDTDARLATEAGEISLIGDIGAQHKASMSSVLYSAIAARKSIKISSVSGSWSGTTTLTVVIAGIAPTRESLLSFQGRLEALAPGNKVDLPVSELAKASDIKFSLSLVTQPKQ